MCFLFACGGGGSMLPEEAFHDSAHDKNYQSGNSLITGFFKNDDDQGIFDGDPSIKQGGISYLLIKSGNTGYVNVKVSFSSSSSFNSSTSSTSTIEITNQNQLIENKYCISKISEYNCIKEFSINEDDKKNGYKIVDFKTNEAYPGHPIYYGLYTFNEESQNEWTLLAELHTYAYFEDKFTINIFQLGKPFFLNDSFQKISKKTFERAGITITYQLQNYLLSDKLDGSSTKKINYGLDGSYLAIKASQREECYSTLKDDIDLIMDDLQNDAENYNYYGRRVALALGLPTHKYWTFEKDDFTGDIIPCLSPIDEEIPQENKEYLIQPIYSSEDSQCPIFDSGKSISAKLNHSVWFFNDGNGWKEGLFTDYVETTQCLVLIEKESDLNKQYLKPHLKGAIAITEPIQASNSVNYDDFAKLVSINKYTKSDFRPEIHEIGHLLGLVDIDDDFLGFKEEEQNLMHKNDLSNGFLLRGRAMKYKDDSQKVEHQWDCLHRITNKSCVNNNLHSFDNVKYLMEEADYEFH